MSITRGILWSLFCFIVEYSVVADTNKLEVLSVEKAIELIGKPGTIRLNGLRTMDLEVSKVLARQKIATAVNHSTTDLYLKGLSNISKECAEVLSSSNAILHLDNLLVLDSIPLAKKLATQKGELHLDKIKTLSLEVATILAGNKNNIIAPGCACKNRTSVLRFSSLAVISKEVAEVFSHHKGTLVLNGLKSISKDVAIELSKHEGVLVLNALEKLTPEISEILSTCEGDLSLKAIDYLSVPSAMSLSQHKFKLYLDGRTKFSLLALDRIREHPNVVLAENFESVYD